MRSPFDHTAQDFLIDNEDLCSKARRAATGQRLDELSERQAESSKKLQSNHRAIGSLAQPICRLASGRAFRSLRLMPAIAGS